MPQSPLPDAKRRVVERLLRAGKMVYADIAAKAGVSAGTVAKAARRIGVSGKKAKKAAELRRRVHDEVKKGGSFREIGRRVGAHNTTVGEIAKQTLPPEPDRSGTVESRDRLIAGEKSDRNSVVASEAGWWLVLGDVHIPRHDATVIELAVNEAREKQAVGVLLNGDIMDMFGVSPFYREPNQESIAGELEAGRAFFSWLRRRLPIARIIYREGNHEFRLTRYIAGRAAALFDLPEVRLQNLLRLADHGVEWVQDKRRVMLGKLPTLHGHELRKGSGINPARLAFLRTTSSLMVGHHHRTSEHFQKTMDGRNLAVWSVGCACDLSPDYDPYGDSNHGYAMVKVEEDGWHSVVNRRVIDGRVV